MSGCYGNNPEDRAREAELNRYLDKTYGQPASRQEEIDALVVDKFKALPDLYASMDGKRRYANIEDASSSIKQAEWIAIARLLRDGDEFSAGFALKNALMRVLIDEAEDEINDRR